KAFFIGASHSQEDGWRDFSPTRATQVFADARYRNENSEVNLSLTYANTDLIGNGPAPDSLIAVDRRAIFTQPDRTRNTLWMLSTGAKLQTGDEAQLTALIYQRRSDIKTLNGDASAYDECGNLPGFVCQPGTNQVALDQNGVAIIFTPQVDGGALNRSDTEQVGRGVALQWVSTTSLQHRENHFLIGASIDHSDSKFGSNTELGSFDATRAAIGSGEFASDAQVGLKTSANNYSVFFSDTFSISQQTAVTAAGRYFRQSIGLRDQLGTELNGDHRFSRFNPSLGIATQIGNFATAYASYAESSRTPSPVELTCANPGDPCRLPNAFLTDPPLDQVIAKTFEAGLRGKWKNNHWHIGAFRTINHYDIIFVSAGALTNEGYFTNVRATQRQGIEVLIKGATNGKLGWFLNYTFLDATFQDDLQIASANNPLATNGVIDVHRGDRLPSAPRHLAKLGFDWDLHRWLLSADVHYASSQFARGDEANLLSPLPAYVVVNAQIGYRFTDKAALDLSVRNVFDNDYATFATFGQSGDVLGTAPKSERFSTPAAPRSVWIALRVGFN
ncbi:MAG TPA: TonB-dependent receptor, partial [Steroidobacteraceae bacterium]|nr:TonB-dependent receptor [Steroidobacteraceae bacterium]